MPFLAILANTDPAIVYLLLSGIGAVTGALVYVAKIVQKDCADCKKDRENLRRENLILTLLISKHFDKPLHELEEEGQELYRRHTATPPA